MEKNNLWIEKYRPVNLEDLVLSEDAKKLIEKFKKEGEIPHLLLMAPPGTGKTTLAKLIVNSLLDTQYIYINASDKNGIDTIRDEITRFVQTRSLNQSHKTVILDEADGLTADSQRALRNLMEEYSATTRFVLTANFKHKIIEPLKSRCQTIECLFNSKKQFAKHLLEILSKENVSIADIKDKNILFEAFNSFYPDFRSAINWLQQNTFDGKFVYNKPIKTKELTEILLQKVVEDKGIEEIRKFVIESENKFNSDYQSLLKDLFETVYSHSLPQDTKRKYLLTISMHLEYSTRAVDQEINFSACILNMLIP